MTPNRIVVDTNQWLSFLITNEFAFLEDAIEDDAYTIIFSSELVHEFVEVCRRPKFRKYFSLERIQSILAFLDQYCELIEVTSAFEVCRDKKDNFLLSLVHDGNADYLITGDKDLLTLEQFGTASIVNMAEFKEIIKK